ncbi:LysM peptidoglycan-binding domain-containing protein [Rothia sp. LK2588]|uniref:LysM peptidoglycan-binding domain-containing protein n=1 Tax=Rothia sp. LK2588 TaxID=3114369 RepID=UPI0034CE4F67
MLNTLTISQTSNYVPFSPFFQDPAEKEPDQPTYTVRSGDTLWAIAAQELNTTDPVRIAAGVHRLFEANDHVLASPDSLIYPGQELHIPKNV